MVVTLEGHGKALIFIDKHQRLILHFLLGHLNLLEEIEDRTLKFVSTLDFRHHDETAVSEAQTEDRGHLWPGYCLKAFADIVCYYRINHKIGHLGNNPVTIVAFFSLKYSMFFIVLFSVEI